MRSLHSVATAVLLLLSSYVLSAQQADLIRCSTTEHMQSLREKFPSQATDEEFEQWLAPKIEAYKKNYDPSKNNVITIPVVVHVLHNGEGVGDGGPNISDAQVFSQIKVLNDDFRRLNGDASDTREEFLTVAADVELSFVMAQTAPDGSATNGINRVDVGQDGLTRDDIENTWKPATQWEPTQYLNMWSVKFAAPDDNLLGYAQFPDDSGLPGVNNNSPAETDGVVMRFNSFGSSREAGGDAFALDAPYDLGRTATHEVGHWVGLRHVWGDGLGCNTGAAAGETCSCTVDDFCNDTPNSGGANYGCALNKFSTCDALPTTDQIENYMDYTNDECMNMFTADQKARVQAVMANSPRRKELKDSPALLPPGTYVTFSEKTSEDVEGTLCDGTHEISIPVQISDIPDADVTVSVNVSGDAVEGVDYQLVSNTVTFASGDNAAQNVTISVTEDFAAEGDEFIVLTLATVATSGTAQLGFSNIEHVVRLKDDDFEPLRAGLSSVAPFYTEDFDNGASGWTNGLSAGNVSWYEGLNGDFFTFGVGAGSVAFVSIDGVNANYNQAASGTARYVSPAIDTRGVQNMTLTFDYIVHGEGGTEVNYDFLRVEYSIDGTNFKKFGDELVGTLLTATSGTFTAPLPQEAENIETLYLALRWDNDGIQGTINSAAVDNISLAGAQRGPAIIATTETATSISVDIAANETVHFYDANNQVIATLENGSQELGCTTLDILGAGNAANIPQTNLGANVEAASKTIRITPALNAATADYALQLYYTEAEINDWIADLGNNTFPTIVSIDDFKMFKTNDADAASATTENTQVAATTTYTSYDVDGVVGYAFRTTFTGFSVFGGTNVSFPFTVAETISNADCFGDANGAISLDVTEATGLVTFNWSTGVSGVGENEITGLVAGTYDVTISDTGGNVVETSYTVTQPDEILLSFSTTDERCSDATGTATAMVENATTYTINWSNGTTGDQDNRTITGLAAGSYNAQIVDANNCTSASVEFVINDTGARANTTEVIQQISCAGATDGVITLNTVLQTQENGNETTSFQYDWSNGTSGLDVNTIDNLAAGMYSATVTPITDGQPGCESVVGPFSIVEPNSVLDLTNVVADGPTDCDNNDGGNGTISLTPTGGSGTYEFSWSNGTMETGASSTITQLTAGTYEVTVADGTDCKLTSVTIECRAGDALPVQIIEFEARLSKQQQAAIHWRIGTEQQVQHYNVLRSSNAKDWQVIETIAATNNGHYDMTDSQLLGKFQSGQMIFYRLQVVELDGAKTLSPIRQLQLPTLPSAIAVAPNPTTGVFQLQLVTNQEMPAMLEIVAINGQLVQTVSLEAPHTRSQHTIDVNTLQAGVYFLRIHVVEGTLYERIVIE